MNVFPQPHRAVGEVFRQARESRGMSRAEAARAMGYRNVNRGIRRFETLESGKPSAPEFVERVISLFEIEPEALRRAAAEDFARWERWLDEPVPMSLALKPFAGFYLDVPIPEELAEDPDAAEAYACDLARERHMIACLVVSRRLSVWIAADGTVDGRVEAELGQINEPYMKI